MFKLDTTRALEVTLAATITSNQLQGSVSYIDMPPRDTSDRMKQLGAAATFTTNSITDTTAVPAPLVSGTIREWDGFNLYNADSVTARVTVKINTSNTDTILVKQSLAPSETLFCTQQNGWGII